MPTLLTGPALALTISALAGLVRGQQAPPTAAASPAQLRLVGEFELRLLQVAGDGPDTSVLTVTAGTLRSSIDEGDTVVVKDPRGAETLATGRVVTATRAMPGADRLHVRVRFADAAQAQRLPQLAPTAGDAEPRDATQRAARLQDRALETHAAMVVIESTFDAATGDDIADFVRITDTKTGRRVACADAVPTSCALTIRCREPLDARSLIGVQLLVGAAKAAEAQVPMRAVFVDPGNCTLRFEPPFGLPFTPAMHRRPGSPETGQPHYRLHIAGGPQGLRTVAGATLPTALELPITIAPGAADNLVGWR